MDPNMFTSKYAPQMWEILKCRGKTRIQASWFSLIIFYTIIFFLSTKHRCFLKHLKVFEVSFIQLSSQQKFIEY